MGGLRLWPSTERARRIRPIFLAVLAVQSFLGSLRLYIGRDVLGAGAIVLMLLTGFVAVRQDMDLRLVFLYGMMCAVNAGFDVARTIDQALHFSDGGTAAVLLGSGGAGAVGTRPLVQNMPNATAPSNSIGPPACAMQAFMCSAALGYYAQAQPTRMIRSLALFTPISMTWGAFLSWMLYQDQKAVAAAFSEAQPLVGDDTNQVNARAGHRNLRPEDDGDALNSHSAPEGVAGFKPFSGPAYKLSD